MLDNFDPVTDEKKRQLYVAMTRAKQNLTIHLNGNYLDHITAENLERIEDTETHLPASQLVMHLIYNDIWLDYFINKQHLISTLKSGNVLTINGNECKNSNGQSILKFSKPFLITIETLNQNGFQLKKANVNFILYWKRRILSKK